MDANTAVIQGLILSFKCVNHKHGGCFTTFYIAVVLGNSRGGFRVETDQNSSKYWAHWIKIESNPVCSRFKVRIFERVCSSILVDELWPEGDCNSGLLKVFCLSLKFGFGAGRIRVSSVLIFGFNPRLKIRFDSSLKENIIIISDKIWYDENILKPSKQKCATWRSILIKILRLLS